MGEDEYRRLRRRYIEGEQRHCGPFGQCSLTEISTYPPVLGEKNEEELSNVNLEV